MTEEIKIDSFKGIAPKYGDNLPVGFAQSAINCSLAKGKLVPLAKNTLIQADTNHYNSFAYYNSAWLRQNNAFYCPWKIGVLDLLLYRDTSGYLKKKVLWQITKSDISFTAAAALFTGKVDISFVASWELHHQYDISFDALTGTITSASAAFDPTEFPTGRKFTVSGSYYNNTVFTVSAVAATTSVITVTETIVEESAGSPIIIKTTNEIRSAASEFVPASYSEGTKFTISGSASNDRTYTVSSIAATIAVVTVDETLTDEAAGAAIDAATSNQIGSIDINFNPFSLITGAVLTVSGSAHNNGIYTVSSDASTTLIPVNEALITEAAGASITIKVIEEDYLGQTRQEALTVVAGAVPVSGELGIWLTRAGQLGSETTIGVAQSLVEFNDKLYGGTEAHGKLYEWDEVSSWIERAGQFAAQIGIHSMCVFGTKLYGTSYQNGKLFEWDGTSTWVEKAPMLDEQCMHSMIVYHNELYAGTTNHGRLYKWNGTDAWVQMAPQLGGAIYVRSLAVFNDKIYGGTDDGRLLEWNGVNLWVEKAPQLGAESDIYSLCVFNSKLYGSTGPNGKLYEWNGVNAWVEKAAQLGVETQVFSLVIFNSGLYAGTYPSGQLFQWNRTDSWILRAEQSESQTAINALAIYDNKLYGGTGPGGMLFEFEPSEDSYSYQYIFTLTRNVGGHIDESGPSAVSTAITMITGQTATVTRPVWVGLGTDTYVTHWNLYRLSNATGTWMLVEQIPWATTSYVDSVADADLGGTPPSYYTSDQGNEIIWDIPIKNLDGITTIPVYGIIFGWKGSTLYWSESGYPDAWVAFYTMNFPAAIKNVIPHGGAVAVLTSQGPFRVDGDNAEVLQQSPPLGRDPATSIFGCYRTSSGVLYLSDSGIVLFNMASSTIVTDEGFGEEWFKANVSPIGAVMIEVDNVVYLFHSGGGLMIDGRALGTAIEGTRLSEAIIATTLSEIIYGVYRKEDDDDLYVMDGAGIQKFGTAAGTKAMTWKSGDLLGDHPEEKTFIETELMGSAVEVTVSNYVDGTLSKSAALAMSTTRNRRLGFLDDLCMGRAAQIQIYKAAHDTLIPSQLEMTEAIVRYTR